MHPLARPASSLPRRAERGHDPAITDRTRVFFAVGDRATRKSRLLNATQRCGFCPWFGPGLLEGAYHACLRYELERANLRVKANQRLPLTYKTLRIDCAYVADLIVEDAVIVEIKAVENLARIHKCQLFTYLSITDRRVGLVLNFGAERMRDGIQRVVNRFPEH